MTSQEENPQAQQNCIFCSIISEKIPAKKIFEDEKVLAILDINPLNLGHILVLPKEHYFVMAQMPTELTQHIFLVAKGLSQTVLSGLKSNGVTGTNIFVANGQPAGQKAPHFMLHIIPRKEKDGVTTFDLIRGDPSIHGTDIQEKISEKLFSTLKDFNPKKIKASVPASKEKEISTIGPATKNKEEQKEADNTEQKKKEDGDKKISKEKEKEGKQKEKKENSNNSTAEIDNKTAESQDKNETQKKASLDDIAKLL